MIVDLLEGYIRKLHIPRVLASFAADMPLEHVQDGIAGDNLAIGELGDVRAALCQRQVVEYAVSGLQEWVSQPCLEIEVGQGIRLDLLLCRYGSNDALCSDG